MILTAVLFLGCLLWMAGEAMTIVAGSIAPGPGWIATLGLYVAGAGLFALKDLELMGKPGRVGIVLSAFGAFSFATVLTIVLTSGLLGAMAEGVVTHGQMVFTPFYLLALVFAVSGLVALGLHFRAAGETGLALVAAVLAIASFLRLVLADLPLYHELVSLAVGAYFLALGVKRWRLGGQVRARSQR